MFRVKTQYKGTLTHMKPQTLQFFPLKYSTITKVEKEKHINS